MKHSGEGAKVRLVPCLVKTAKSVLNEEKTVWFKVRSEIIFTLRLGLGLLFFWKMLFFFVIICALSSGSCHKRIDFLSFWVESTIYTKLSMLADAYIVQGGPY